MSVWLGRLKSGKTDRPHATKPAELQSDGFEAGSVGFVAPPRTPCSQFEGAKIIPKVQAANDALSLVADADRWGWPHSLAMNTREIDVFIARVDRIVRRGADLDAAETVADKLVIRDREQDERRCCLECACLRKTDIWRCGNWQKAQACMGGLTDDAVMQLQRCPGFRP